MGNLRPHLEAQGNRWTDILARLMGQFLSQRLGQQFVIENRPGAGGNIAAETVIKAAPDGYTLLMVPPAVAANATLYQHLSFNFIRDTVPVAGIVRVPNVVEVNPSVPVKTIPELIAYAKAHPLSFALGRHRCREPSGGPSKLIQAALCAATALDWLEESACARRSARSTAAISTRLRPRSLAQ